MWTRLNALIPRALRFFSTLQDYISFWKKLLPLPVEYRASARLIFVSRMSKEFGIPDSMDVQIAYQLTLLCLGQEVASPSCPSRNRA